MIRRPPEDVDFSSDLRSELRWNPKAKYVENLTDGRASRYSLMDTATIQPSGAPMAARWTPRHI